MGQLEHESFLAHARKRQSHLVVSEAKQLLSETVVLFSGPLVAQQADDLVMARDKHVAVPPNGIWRVRELYFLRVPLQGDSQPRKNELSNHM